VTTIVSESMIVAVDPRTYSDEGPERCEPEAAKVVDAAYKGLVPMSPKTIPMAAITGPASRAVGRFRAVGVAIGSFRLAYEGSQQRSCMNNWGCIRSRRDT
jgi:hypothetical protein